MCREDIRIGRQRRVSTRLVAFNTGNPVRVCAASDNRVFVAISGSDNAIVVFSKNDINSLAEGLAVNGTYPLELDIERYGQFVTGEIWMDGVTVASTGYVVEVFYDDGQYP